MTTLTLTIRQAAEAHAALGQWNNTKLPAQAAYWIARTKRQLESLVEPFAETRNSKAVEYGAVRDGSIDPKAEGYAKFIEEIGALLDDQTEVDIRTARLSTFAKARVQPAIVFPLLAFFEDESGWESGEVSLSMEEVLELDGRLAQVALDVLPFMGAYFLARMIDGVSPMVADFSRWRAKIAYEMGVVNDTGVIDLSHPNVEAYRRKLEDRVRSSGEVGIRYPRPPFSILDEEGVEISPALLSAMWFVWEEK